jgi:DNA-binding response OmpR family regulator
MNGTPSRIVIVEDDPSLQRALHRLLRAAGFETQCFGSAEAMESAGAAKTAACLVMDVQLPGMSGPDCYAHLHHPRPPVMFMTAYDSHAVRQAVQQAGAEWVLQKPFTGDALLRLVNRLLAWTPPEQAPQ